MRKAYRKKIASLTEELAGIMARTGASDLSQNESFCYMESVISGNPFPHKAPSYGNRAAFCVWEKTGCFISLERE